ncbi:MAG: hypothetical protein IKF17_01380 [Clostridia bacterium]|nr:hypothetical protein [Clostridia bacterium]
MGKAVFDILRENGATWIEVPGDFTKRITDDKVQVFLSLSPNGDKLVSYCEFQFGKVFKQFDLPLNLSIPKSLSYNNVVANIRNKYLWVNPSNIFMMKNRFNDQIACTIHPFAYAIIIYGILDGKEHFETLFFDL